MKPISFFLLLALSTTLLFSCKKDDADNNDNPPEQEIPHGIAAKINGSEWSAIGNQGIDMNNSIFLLGTTSNGVVFISLRIPSDAQSGDVFNFPTTNQDELQAAYSNLSGTFFAKSGKITVKKHDTATQSLEGTFEFEGESAFSGGTASVKEGTFNLTYQ